jgi:uncharacterized protein YggE
LRSLFVAGVLVALPVVLGSQSRTGRSEQPEVRTSATAERGVPPDLATVTLQFSAQGGTPSEAGRRLAAKADSLRRALAKLGIPHDSLVNRNRWYWWRGRIETVPLPVRYVQRQTPTSLYSEPVQDTAYRAHDAIEVRIRDLSKVGAVLDAVMSRGVTDIAPVQFTATKVTGAQLEALREATVRARGQAQAMAEASGMRLGAVLSLSTQPDYSYEYSSLQWRGTVTGSMALDGGQAGTVVVQPAISVSVTVHGRWALVKNP